MYIVTLEHQGNRFYLRSTVTTSAIDRATQYETQEQAIAAIAKAATFHKRATIKAMKVIAA